MASDFCIERNTVMLNMLCNFLVKMSSTEIFLSLLVFLFCLYMANHTFRYMFKYVFYVLYVSTMGLFLIPIFAMNPFDLSNLVLGASLCRPVSKILGLHWILRGKEFLKDKRPCVIVSNHQSCIDVLGLFELSPVMGKCTVITRKEVFYIFPFGLVSWLAGLTYINRSNAQQARNQVNEAAVRIKEDKVKLWIFAEGTRRDTEEIHPFKKGGFYAAIHAQLPILPVVFSHYYFLNSKEKRFDPGNAIITALPPISTEGMTADNVEELIERTRTEMIKTFEVVNAEIKQSLCLENGVKK